MLFPCSGQAHHLSNLRGDCELTFALLPDDFTDFSGELRHGAGLVCGLLNTWQFAVDEPRASLKFLDEQGGVGVGCPAKVGPFKGGQFVRAESIADGHGEGLADPGGV